MVIVAIIVIPIEPRRLRRHLLAPRRRSSPSPTSPNDGLLLGNAATLGYSTLAFGSALALFLYPHTMTGRARGPRPEHDQAQHGRRCPPTRWCSACSPCSVTWRSPPASRRSATTRTRSSRCSSTTSSRTGSRASRSRRIAIGALVPAAIMAIAAANLFARNIYKEYLKRDATPEQEARVGEARVARGQGRRAARRARPRPAVLDRPAADRRRDHPADAAGDRPRAVAHARAPLGAARRLGGRAARGPRDALRHAEPGDRPRALRRRPVRALELRLRHRVTVYTGLRRPACST